MTDARLLRAFRTLDAPVDPPAAFADRLFEDLVTDLGLRRARWHAGIAVRIRHVLGLERLSAAPSHLRLAYLAAVLVLLLILVAATLIVGAWLQARPSPEELVRMSQAAYANPPAVRFTIRDATGLSYIASDGRGTWRSVVPSDPQGSYWLYDGDRVGRYDSTVRTWTTWPVTEGGPPYPFNHAFAWVRVTMVDAADVVASVSYIPCPTPTDLGEDVIAARLTDHVGCPTTRTEYWLDRETHLVLRFVASMGSPAWLGPSGEDSVVDVISFQRVGDPAPADFAWAMPDVNAGRIAPIEGTNLVVGQRPAGWSGETLDGRTISTSDLQGPVAILFFAPWCESSHPAFASFASAAVTHPGVTSLIVGEDQVGTLIGYLGQHPVPLPVIADPDNAIGGVWHLQAMPAIVLLDRNGTVVDVIIDAITGADANGVLSALEAGKPIPQVAPPSPTTEPSTSPVSPSPSGANAICDEDRVTCLPVGATVPAWSGPLLAGGTLTSSDLLGRPVVIWTSAGVGHCDGRCPDWVYGELREFAAFVDQYGDTVSFLILSSGEVQPGDTQRQLAEAGVTIPVVFDWDNAISRAIDLDMGGVLVLDAQGRISDQAAGQLAPVTIASALRRLLPSPSNVPAGSPAP